MRCHDLIPERIDSQIAYVCHKQTFLKMQFLEGLVQKKYVNIVLLNDTCGENW